MRYKVIVKILQSIISFEYLQTLDQMNAAGSSPYYSAIYWRQSAAEHLVRAHAHV